MLYTNDTVNPLISVRPVLLPIPFVSPIGFEQGSNYSELVIHSYPFDSSIQTIDSFRIVFGLNAQRETEKPHKLPLAEDRFKGIPYLIVIHNCA